MSGQQMTKVGRLRELIASSCLAMPGVPNAAFARQVERAGFSAVYISGAGLCNMTAGLPDIGLLTLTEVTRLAGWIAQAVKIPAIVDADTGFGGAENAARTVRELEAAGLAGCHVEDQEFPKRCGHLAGKSLIAVEEMNAKLQAAASAKRDSKFLLIARTDARAVESFDGAVKRAQQYVAAGADAIFPEALQTADEFRDFAREVNAPLLANMTEFGKSPLLDLKQLEDFGYRMVIYPQSALRVALKVTEELFAALKSSGTQREWLDRMQTRQELYELLEYEP
ncbi:MAG: methylisocitrate lyase [Chthoniobacterales bacterium]